MHRTSLTVWSIHLPLTLMSNDFSRLHLCECIFFMGIDHNSVFGSMVVVATTAKTKCFADVIPERFGKPNILDTDVPFIMGVGGSFDVVSGKVKRAPKWMQKSGLEWLYRVYQEPRRMWKRYLVTNTKFIGLVLKERVKKTFNRKK